VNYSVAVHVFDCRTNLIYITLHFKLVQSFSTTKQFVEGLVRAKLKQDVNVLSILEEVLEANNVVVVQGAMNFNFGHKFCFSA